MADEKLTALQDSTTMYDSDLLAVVKNVGTTPVTKAQALTILKALLKTYNDTLYSAIGWAANGWVAGTGTWSYSSADAPTFIISINADVTAIIGVGDRIKITQSTGGTKYFIVTVVGSYGGGATLVTVYGGTDYTLNNEAISSPYYSHQKHPLGFPMDETKWTVSLSDTSSRDQASPTAATWYNLGSLSISIPIGLWKVRYDVAGRVANAADTQIDFKVTLSTANNSQSDALNTFMYNITMASAAVIGIITCQKQMVISAASKTTYYLNALTARSGCSAINFRGDLLATIVKVVCAYL